MVYSSNLCDDDRPYFKDLGKGQSIMELPIHWANYDLPYFAFNYRPAFPAGQGRIANYTAVLNNWKDEFCGCYEYGLCYVLQLDPSAIGSPDASACWKTYLPLSTVTKTPGLQQQKKFTNMKKRNKKRNDKL